MKLIKSLRDGQLLHIVHRKEDFIEERNNIIEETQFLQLSTLRMNDGKTFKPHKHIWKPGTEQCIAQESWVVISGKVRCHFFDIDNTPLEEVVLTPGDCSITLQGGHTYTILQDDTLVYEFKTGPYTGQKNDKVFLDEE